MWPLYRNISRRMVLHSLKFLDLGGGMFPVALSVKIKVVKVAGALFTFNLASARMKVGSNLVDVFVVFLRQEGS